MPFFTSSAFKTALIATLWLAVAGALFYFMNTRVNPNTADTLSQSGEVVLQRDLSGHYRAEAYINGVSTPVMVDTGATDVAISQALADRLGLRSIKAVRTHTANGDTVSYMVRLKNVKLGGIVAHDVAAIITPKLGDEVLLGMSFLGRMDVRLYKGLMTIRASHE
ncbi:MAG: peptidase A2 [Gallionellales bacterium 35-53-114]|jgi:aspartyl protease family protein|nr:MAG: peptidase A2 [Gallionellales bacterium 35-53-114]OYZ62358.1 MAG: peptidase A2 [Gallionellales bacterium 24-53-125]OZB07398.1 MAG: peptidase A2 [Gallionellales bacterium 39-52-133]HQS59572.1 retropepsin-like aspartic protease [Gallionellaceae bacterium]HQS75525.1 retropepsin-like aspartic protease [Gallionellaceae bacterium]